MRRCLTPAQTGNDAVTRHSRLKQIPKPKEQRARVKHYSHKMTCSVADLLFMRCFTKHTGAAKNDSNQGKDWPGVMNASSLKSQTTTNGLDYSSDIVRDYEVVIYAEG